MNDDYWYENQHELEQGMVFRCTDNGVVRLDSRVPGDGTKWYVDEWDEGEWWCADGTIEPVELAENLPGDYDGD